MTTIRQKLAVRFCERILNITFKGNINNYDDVSEFLTLYLDSAELALAEAEESYNNNFDW